ncbi:LysR family transcriptional regulator [Amphritea sp. 2_MG-2023]|uniref:LysR family transcriptional regulator n=1 Tax=Amphritea TaxID=515417 RepID=UPI001C071FE9|nr:MULTISPECIES: LysR family transcriptional regulator [Amphritea]MBU2964519.1 LysR family transcriptional regulator [Amphritea atlantica]MDO6417847.1 LysR family transcriptional regulator [Amphritea sp. 2_MG-2023]
MDTNSLQAFVAVAESGSFSRAAEQLFLTQSAMSKRILILEQQLNNRLFDRIGRTVSLTEAGRELLPRARRILLELEDARRSLSNLRGDVSGTLSVAASHHISLHRLPPVLRQYSSDFPEVKLDLRFDESEIAYDNVVKGNLEIALITLAPSPDPNIHCQTIWRDKLNYVVATDHPLASLQQVTLEQLCRYPAILSGSATFTRQLAEQQFSQLALQPDIAMSTNYLDTIRMMVEIGLGWSLLPETMTENSLTVLKVDAPAVTRELGYITHKERTLSNAARHFIQLLEQAAEKGS